MDQWLSASVAPRRFQGLLQSLFSLATLLLAAVGLYGLVAHAVTCRTREIGVHMALGAGRSAVALMVPTRPGPDLAPPRPPPPPPPRLTLLPPRRPGGRHPPRGPRGVAVGARALSPGAPPSRGGALLDARPGAAGGRRRRDSRAQPAEAAARPLRGRGLGGRGLPPLRVRIVE